MIERVWRMLLETFGCFGIFHDWVNEAIGSYSGRGVSAFEDCWNCGGYRKAPK